MSETSEIESLRALVKEQQIHIADQHNEIVLVRSKYRADLEGYKHRESKYLQILDPLLQIQKQFGVKLIEFILGTDKYNRYRAALIELDEVTNGVEAEKKETKENETSTSALRGDDKSQGQPQAD